MTTTTATTPATRPAPTTPLDSVRAAWDRAAANYDTEGGHGLRTSAEHAAWANLLARLLPPSEPLTVLDVGTGTGILALLLAELGHRVVGIDVSPGMLEQARNKCRGFDVTLHVAHAHTTGQPDGTFDVVISRHVLWALTDPEDAVREWIRVSRPGGRVIAIDGIWDRAGALGRYVLAFQQRRDRRRDQGATPPVKPTPLIQPLKNPNSTRPAENTFARAGLTDVRAEELRWIDRIERQAMTRLERISYRWERYLVEGHVPLTGATP
jgi:ubiquinone/menaquinone biosynthesis C-methylase UbiE